MARARWATSAEKREPFPSLPKGGWEWNTFFLRRPLASSVLGQQPRPTLRGFHRDKRTPASILRTTQRQTGSSRGPRCKAEAPTEPVLWWGGRWRGQSRLRPHSPEGMNRCSREGTCHKHRPTRVRAGRLLSCMGHELKYVAQNPRKAKHGCCAVFTHWGQRAHLHLAGLKAQNVHRWKTGTNHRVTESWRQLTEERDDPRWKRLGLSALSFALLCTHPGNYRKGKRGGKCNR